jgi:hypothetical protein
MLTTNLLWVGAKKWLKSIKTFLQFNFIYVDFFISENYALEIALLHPIRSLSDGLVVCRAVMNADWYKADHNPRYECYLEFLNWMIFEVRIYNVNHEEERK